MTVCQECGINTLMFGGNHSPGCSQFNPETVNVTETDQSTAWVNFIEGTKERGVHLATGILAKTLMNDLGILEGFTDLEKLEIVLGDEINTILDLAVWAGVISCLQTTMEQHFLDPDKVSEYTEGTDIPDPKDW